MSLNCDGCDAEITDQTRPEAYAPLANGGGVDLCRDCKTALNMAYGVEDPNFDNEYPNE